MGVTPKVQQDMALQGGRHYKGRGLGQLKTWKCVSCDAPNTGPLQQGCVACGAGKPGQQVRKPGDPLPKADEKVVQARNQVPAQAGGGLTSPFASSGSAGPRRPTSLAEQVRRSASAASVDYDEIERRLAKVLEQRLGGGYNAAERARLYDALEVLITLWEDGSIAPAGGLSLEQTRELARKVAPEDMETTDGASESTTAGERYSGDPEGDPAERGYSHGHPSDGDNPGADGPSDATGPGHSVATGQPARSGPNTVRPAPELLDADHRGDEGGEDDAAGNGG